MQGQSAVLHLKAERSKLIVIVCVRARVCARACVCVCVVTYDSGLVLFQREGFDLLRKLPLGVLLLLTSPESSRACSPPWMKRKEGREGRKGEININKWARKRSQ